MDVVTVAEMRAIEQRAAADYGLTPAILMEHAGRSIAEHLRGHLTGGQRRALAGQRVLVLVGPGNNGGDGRVMGRYLSQWGASVTYYAWKERQIEAAGAPVPDDAGHSALRAAIGAADVVADALLGTGHARPLDAHMAAVLALVREERARRPTLLVLAVDLPSGLNADTGALDPGTLAADLTVTLAFPKAGLFFFPGAAALGVLRVGSIGLPPQLRASTRLEMMNRSLVRTLLPARPLESHKGTYGQVLVLAGSSLYVGAAYLATAAAARVGAGLVTLATIAERAPFYATMMAEATYALLPPTSAPPEERAAAVIAALRGRQAAVIGPGLGQDDATRALLRLVLDGIPGLSDAERPRLIVDADGLNNLARVERWWERLPAWSVLTPHPGEMARLRGGQPVSAGGPDRLDVARDAARAWGHVVVLKGACTLVAAPDGRVRVNWPGNPAMASAGTGDVLAGAVGGLLAQGVEPFDAASAAVYLHSRAGLRVRARQGDAGLLASDLLPELPHVLARIKRIFTGAMLG